MLEYIVKFNKLPQELKDDVSTFSDGFMTLGAVLGDRNYAGGFKNKLRPSTVF
jgi:hypothetical protein